MARVTDYAVVRRTPWGEGEGGTLLAGYGRNCCAHAYGAFILLARSPPTARQRCSFLYFAIVLLDFPAAAVAVAVAAGVAAAAGLSWDWARDGQYQCHALFTVLVGDFTGLAGNGKVANVGFIDNKNREQNLVLLFL